MERDLCEKMALREGWYLVRALCTWKYDEGKGVRKSGLDGGAVFGERLILHGNMKGEISEEKKWL